MKNLRGIRLMLLSMVLLIVLAVPLGLGGCVTEEWSHGLREDMLDGFRAVIGDDSVALGIVSPTESAAAHGGELTPSRTRNMDAGGLVSVDALGRATEVFFHRIGDESDVITQGQLGATVSNIYITEDFIYFELNTLGYTRDATNFFRNHRRDWMDRDGSFDVKSFLIDRVNNNVYSLAQFGSFWVSGRVIRVEHMVFFHEDGSASSSFNPRAFRLSISQDSITYTLLNPNPAIQAYGTFDTGETIFVMTPGITEDYVVHPNFDDVVFVRGNRWGGSWNNDEWFALCQDGQMFRIGRIGDRHNGVQVFRDGGFRRPLSQELVLSEISFHFGMVIDSIYGNQMIVRDGRAFLVSRGIHSGSMGIGVRVAGYVGVEDDAIFLNLGNWFSRSTLLGQYLVQERDGNFYYVDTKCDESFVLSNWTGVYAIAWTQILAHRPGLSFRWVGRNGGVMGIVAVREDILGTVEYFVYASEDGVRYMLYQDVVHDTTFYVLLPL